MGFVIGDGDNLNFLKGSRHDWFKQRLDYCGEAARTKGRDSAAYLTQDCFPLIWTVSPTILKDAPDMLRWYYDASYETGQDFFTLPPSGDLYAYPGKSLIWPHSPPTFRVHDSCPVPVFTSLPCVCAFAFDLYPYGRLRYDARS